MGVPLAVASLVVGLAQLRAPRDGADAARAKEQAATLARLVATSEGLVLTQLLGSDTARIDLHYDRVPSPGRAAQAPVAGLAVADPPTGLPDITAYYRSTRPARLVITGAPGAGKTVLALQLLLGLIAKRDTVDPVPVRVPLAQWDTDIPLRDVLVQRLVDAFKMQRAVAENLVAHELVLPLLDGLDEMDPPLTNGDPDPTAPRARAALEQLSKYQNAGAAAPLVLTCRTAHYDALATMDPLLDSARIAVAPVDACPAVAYLAARARDLPRWQPLLNHITTQPGSVHAVLLSTPWRLCLTATVYHRSGDPAEVLAHTTPGDLDDHLLGRYITAVTSAAGEDANPHRYDPRQIHHWLHQLATHLAPTPSTPARTDIDLGSLWPLAGQALVRTCGALLTTLIIFLPLPFVLFAQVTTTVHLSFMFPIQVTVPVAYIASGGIGVLALMIGINYIVAGPGDAGRLGLRRLATAEGWRQLTNDLVMGTLFTLFCGGITYLFALYVVVLPVGLMFGMATVQTVALGTGLAGGLAWGVFFLLVAVTQALGAAQNSAAKPGAVIGENARLGLVAGLVAGLIVGLASGLAVGLTVRLCGGIAAGLAGSLLSASCAWRYLVFLLCAFRKVPFRLARFLDWSCHTGLMRYSGPAYQFRHRELQLWLAAHPDPVT
ncbi:NACHT domain-containing protein [Streptomyces sp. NBC_00328]|uniref:NACHT domain-containing protein n=1 Tax=Streptomyces sp. NBC_00328 TaxID=2903646 RepID=UPI002E287899|nr:NACHT domain-containing protein [Streptomyces sp. NBC_00328]